MNIDTLAGEGTQLKGDLKQGLGDSTNDPALRQDGAVDQLSGSVRKGFGQVRDFASQNKVATAAAAAVFGLGLLSSLRKAGAKV
jgi:uncharacterized protein YjbJ (UPF0337 family)